MSLTWLMIFPGILFNVTSGTLLHCHNPRLSNDSANHSTIGRTTYSLKFALLPSNFLLTVFTGPFARYVSFRWLCVHAANFRPLIVWTQTFSYCLQHDPDMRGHFSFGVSVFFVRSGNRTVGSTYQLNAAVLFVNHLQHLKLFRP